MTRTRSYWIIIAGDRPTAFRSKDRESLEPTLHQLKRTQPDVLLRWFEANQLWDTPEAAAEARERQGRAGGQAARIETLEKSTN